ncbi:hydroxyproline dehydrogenase isoform X2 [Pseudoliparis swirei]|uniref:hydroxyproline dehydrogenase isoform X2 n=1 Tax=Pseudoliparis swirei TaxID=2059687 RepID=UPI0024BE8C97|nr:hydroxyproline dehydrogenase isoform X2 [Pseudoliparis swirei]
MSRWRPSLPHVSSLRLLGSSASRTAAVQRPGRLSAALAFEESGAFGVKSLGELLRALCIFQLCSFPVLVNNCGKLLTVARALLGRRGFSLLLRPTVYAQFVAGENESEISRSMEKMSSLGLRPMLAVPIEEDLGESAGEKRYDDNMEAMLECVRMSHRNAWSKEPMMQLKVTALLSPDLCVKVTTLISRQPYDLNLLVRAMDGEPIEFPGLNESEVAHFLCGLQRLNKIAEASVNKVRVLVDAEYTYMNPTLSLVTMAMMKKFNKDDAWIWNTYQCYLKESGSLLAEALRLSSDEGFCLGVKLVRGAYMDKERKLAEKEGRLDPVHQRWEDTNDRMEELGMDHDGGSVCFGQLLGMCDHVSLTLAKEGYAVYKSVPYGSVDDTLPYLVRRAQENRIVLQGIRKERNLLRKELYRRLTPRRGGQ